MGRSLKTIAEMASTNSAIDATSTSHLLALAGLGDFILVPKDGLEGRRLRLQRSALPMELRG